MMLAVVAQRARATPAAQMVEFSSSKKDSGETKSDTDSKEQKPDSEWGP
jgi:hypothetical protein